MNDKEYKSIFEVDKKVDIHRIEGGRVLIGKTKDRQHKII